MRPGLFFLFLGLMIMFSGCIQQQSGPQVSEKAATEEWKADGLVGDNEYSRSIDLSSPARQGYSGGNLSVFWKNDEEYLYMALKGKTSGWVSIGFEPSEWMKDADIIMGWVENGQAVTMDEYSTGNYGPHVNDTDLGGSDDILESGGSQGSGYTVLEFKRRMNTGDKFDKAFTPGQEIPVIWAMADSSDHDVKHNVAYGEAVLTLEGGEQKTGVTALSSSEKEGMAFIREEEKAARDLYLSFYDGNNISTFRDVARSEQNHMDQVKVLLDKYGLKDPVMNERGAFANQTLQELYEELLARGKASPKDALQSAAFFEEISIIDLEGQIAATDKEDIKIVYKGLLAGSQKHLRSYVSALEEHGVQYSPQRIGLEEYQRIMRPD